MSELRFRSSFSVRTRLGTRRKYLNRRTSATTALKEPPILVIDLAYIEHLLLSRQNRKQSKYYNSPNLLPLFESWLYAMLHLVTPSGVLFIAKEQTEFTRQLSYPIIYNNIKDYIYSIRVQNSLSAHLVIASNSIDLWSLSSNSANISFIAIDTNNRLLHYNNKTGLEIVSKFIGTYKIINKLGLANLKYLNLQYLFVLLHYLKITNRSEHPFFFDGQYFRNLDKYDTPFLKSNGLGLTLVSDAHKFLSYAFLTKPEFLDFFLLGDAAHYELQLQRLVKLLPIDLKVLGSLKKQYDSSVKPKLVPVVIPNLHPVLPDKCKNFSNIWLEQSTATSFAETKEFAKHLRKYNKYSDYDLGSLVELLPKSLQRDFAKKERSSSQKETDTSDIEAYVSNLISGAF